MDSENDKKVSKMSREHKRPQHRWTKEQTVSFLEAIVDKLKDDPQKFEKPTAAQFYTSLVGDYCLHDLAELGLVAVKNKVRNMRDSFMKAEEWRGQTGAGILEDGKEDTVKEYITKICPHYDMLEQIFGQRKSINLPVIYDTEVAIVEKSHLNYEPVETDYLVNTDNGILIEDTDAKKKNKADQSNPAAGVCNENETEELDNNVTQTPSKNSVDKFKASMKKPGIGEKNKRPVNNSLQYLAMIQEKKNELDEKRICRQIAIEEQRLQIEEGKLQIEQRKLEHQTEIETNKLELEWN